MAKEKIKKKGYMKGTTGHEGLKGRSKTSKRLKSGDWVRMTKKEAAESRAHDVAIKQKNFELAGKPKPKFSRGFKKAAKKQAAKRIAKGVAKSALTKVIGPIGAVLTAAEIAKGAIKVGKSMKAKSACQKRGGIYKKGLCITSKSIKARKKK